MMMNIYTFFVVKDGRAGSVLEVLGKAFLRQCFTTFFESRQTDQSFYMFDCNF
jgi:hypothetical protein